jgi:DNA polymerase III alpha subunit
VSQTPENQTNSSDDVIRKVFARDVKTGQTLHTVFKVTDKERHTAKSGKVFLSMTLVDKTGHLDGRIFENVDAAEAAFVNDDYLLVAGKVALFHGKVQLVIERLEKLDPGPIDAKEFEYTAPPPGEKPEKPERPERAEGPRASKQTRQRILSLLDDPAVSAGVEALLKHLERYIDERVDQRLSGGGSAERRPRPPRSEHRAERSEKTDAGPAAAASAPHKSGLPKDMSFKPFNTLAGEPETPAENSPPNPSAS